MVTKSINAGTARTYALPSSGPSPRRASDRSPHRSLVVINLTTFGEQLAAKVEQRLRVGPCSFHVVVPASVEPRGMTWTEEEVLRAARYRLNHALSVFRAMGADVSGEVGDWMPLLAIEDALRTREFDEIIVSTLSPRISRWIRLDLPHRVAYRFGLPVTHVTSARGSTAVPFGGQTNQGSGLGSGPAFQDREARNA